MKSISKLAIIGSSLIIISSCASMMIDKGKLVNDETRYSRVKDAAAFDFNCSVEKIEISKINETSYAATGCTKKARYTLDKCHDMNWKSVCVAFSNGPMQDI